MTKRERQSLVARERAKCIDELTGEQTMWSICAHLKDHGLFPTSDDVMKQWEYEQTKKIVEDSRSFREKGNELPLMMIPLFEMQLLPDGKQARRNYVKKASEMNSNEWVQHLTYWHKTRKYATKQLRQFSEYAVSKFGLDAIQGRLPFHLPIEMMLS